MSWTSSDSETSTTSSTTSSTSYSQFAARPAHHAVRQCPTPAPTPVPSGSTPSPPSHAGNCRPKLGCMCVNCVDRFDFTVDEPQQIPPICLGTTKTGTSRLDNVLAPEIIGANDCMRPDAMSVGACNALRDRAQQLFPDQPFNGTIEPLVALTVPEVTLDQLYSAKQHDVYWFYTTAARITINLSSLGALSETVTAAQAAPVIYLVKNADDCASPVVISPRVVSDGTPIAVTTEMIFDLPCPDEYMLVLSMVLGNNAADVSGPLTPEQRAAARCIHYGVTVEELPNECPEFVCNLPGCHDSRDCDQSRSCNACDPNSHRCIVGNYTDTCSNELPERDPCADAADGVACIAPLIAGTNDDDDENDGLLRCATGVCSEHTCIPDLPQNLFRCDCDCAAQCTCNSDCDDGNPQTIDRCFEGVCVSRTLPGDNNGTDPTGECNSYTDIELSSQPIISPCTTQHNPPLFSVYDPDLDSNIVSALANSPTSDAVIGFIVCTNGGGNDCTATAEPICIRMVGNAQVQFQCTEPLAPLAVSRATLAATLSTAECALRALDAAELAHATASFDLFGAFNPANQRGAPLCGADIEASRVVVDIETQGPRLDACCSADLRALSRTCLDGARFGRESGHEWLDRAWLALDRSARHLQRGAAADAQREACCASLYYAALADACGRRGDHYQMGVSTRVVRVSGEEKSAVGAQCVLFDDGHVDGDLNDWVAEQRVVEIYDSSHRLRAVNIHVLPLARGGGYKAAYALSLAGSTLRALDRGATAACSSRTRALLHEAYDQAEVGALLRARNGVPARTFVGVSRHALGTGSSLPVGVRHTDCATIGAEGDDTVFCPLATDAVTLFADLRAALPVGGNSTLERLLSEGARFDQSTNTQPNTRRQPARFAVSATVVLPRRGSVGAGSGELRFALINEDCAAAVVLPPTEESVPAEPMALTVPASACGAWRWAAEGHKLVQSAYATDRTCRGGDNGGIEQCGADSGVCTTSGGVCAESPRSEGVPYQYAYEHYTTCAQCRTARQCNEVLACYGSRCCAEQVLHWYKYPTIEHLFVPRNAVSGIETKK